MLIEADSEAQAAQAVGTTLLIERIEQEPTPPQVNPAEQHAPQWAELATPLYRRNVPGYWFFTIIGVLLFVSGLMVLLVTMVGPGWFPSRGRFDDDLAAGATANAVERIEERLSHERPLELIHTGSILMIAGLTSMGLAAVFRIEWRMDART